MLSVFRNISVYGKETARRSYSFLFFTSNIQFTEECDLYYFMSGGHDMFNMRSVMNYILLLLVMIYLLRGTFINDGLLLIEHVSY